MTMLGWVALVYVAIGVAWACSELIETLFYGGEMERFRKALGSELGLKLGKRWVWVFMFALFALFWPMAMLKTIRGPV